MDINKLVRAFGLEEFFNYSAKRFPELKMTIGMKDGKVFVTAVGLGHTSIKLGDDNPGGLLRAAVLEVHQKAEEAEARFETLKAAAAKKLEPSAEELLEELGEKKARLIEDYSTGDISFDQFTAEMRKVESALTRTEAGRTQSIQQQLDALHEEQADLLRKVAAREVKMSDVRDRLDEVMSEIEELEEELDNDNE